MNRYLKALKAHYEAKKQEALANLETYFRKPVGIGEHSDLLVEMQRWTDQLASADDNLSALDHFFDSSGVAVDDTVDDDQDVD